MPDRESDPEPRDERQRRYHTTTEDSKKIKIQKF